MSRISAILVSDDDGNLRLPVPQELRGKQVKVDAEIQAAEVAAGRAKAGLWKSISGQFRVSDDFDAPLEDFREYME